MSAKKPIHQLVHTLSYGDAISGETLALRRCFRELGYESEIYAINIHPKLVGEARLYTELKSDFDGRVLLHYSLGSPLNDLYRRLNRSRRGLIYHNLTPAHWFNGINPRIVNDIKQGLIELPSLCAISHDLIADSKFNASELGKLGFQARVLELPIDPERWHMTSNAGISALLKGDPSYHIVHVGRLAPNKCVEDLIKAFYFFHHHIHRQSKLWLIGIDIDTEIYSFALKRMVYELSLDESVNFIGTFVDAELKALYENATLYVCTSEHEGFCMPVIEAMHFGVPVIAYASSALPDTVASGGILVKQKDPAQLAELMYIACTDGSLRDSLRSAGRARAAELSFNNFSTNVKQLLDSPDISVPNMQMTAANRS